MNYSILEEEKRNISKLLNIDYLKKCSLKNDIAIMVKTVIAVLK